MTARQAVAEALAPGAFSRLRHELAFTRQRARRYQQERDILLGAIDRLRTAEARQVSPDSALEHLFGTAFVIREGDATLDVEVPA